MVNKTEKIIIEEFIRIIELSIIDKAEDIAQQAHLQQYRKRGGKKPYIIHPKRVQLLAKSLHYGIDVQIVSLLHDVIEDANNPDYYYNLIKSKFGIEILNAILLLSHDKDVPYSIYLERLVKSKTPEAELAFRVKMLDMMDNLTDAPSEKQREKYKDAILNLIRLNLHKDVPVNILKLLNIKDVKTSDKILQEAPKKPEKGGSTFRGDDIFGDIGVKKGIGFNDKSDFGNDNLDGGLVDEKSNDNSKEDELSIIHFNNKLKSSKKINKQKMSPEPGFKFGGENDFYNDNYVAQDSKGSLLIAIPSINNNNDIDLEFIKNVVLPKIIKVAYEAMKSGREVVMLGDYGLPYYNGKYSESASGFIAKILNDKFKGTIKFDTWNPQDYYAFTSNTQVWKELKARTQAENAEMKAALYLFLLATYREEDVVNKLKTDDVNKILNGWGFTDNNLNMQIDKEKILRIVFPDKYNNPETLASYIIKMYLQLLRVNMLKKVIQYERENKIVIVLADANTSWSLNKSFKNLQKIQRKAKEKKTNKKQ